ncbi:CDP-diacylglycerol--serine O-phosphatidyltransferase [Natronobacillus azotifigens]|uniref:CDP-alcohol phosphatidyltransferase family protein n=1 Tax=Natronobacillus azotifigens TaxID=472978 RepID=A0A9J6R8Z3_9BACI|nr:CDP-alcohol phosphatidyltransferase family protein [Natronobacillus azotifigens]MCZ0701753.1 CDP-alcohol phosphatidyltransferase family protein [Natronobacillus azotifigens]
MAIKKKIPNLVTFLNLLCGLLAILLISMNPNGSTFLISSILIFLAAITDFLDGHLARRWQAETLVGKELDSLADITSFGFAPILIAFHLYLSNFGWFGFIVVFIYVLSGAYRLACYNVKKFYGVYQGLPITVGGMGVTIINLIVYRLLKSETILTYHYPFCLILILLIAYFMNSKIKMKKIW